jgi:putative membrane protein insertion efficiency factor
MIAKFFITLIRGYQKFISPLLGNNCRFYPTCSHYCLTCFQVFPWYKAIYQSFKRVIKCHPYNDGGYDPVVDEKGCCRGE